MGGSIVQRAAFESFHWNDRFLTGLPEVDAQHQQLVELINRFGDLAAQASGASEGDIDVVFANLADYARHHFATEEALMEAEGIDAHHANQQRQQHRAFIDNLLRMRAKAGSQGVEGARQLLRFLIHWLAGHILGSDQSLGRQIFAIRAGATPAEAYLAVDGGHPPGSDTAAEPLVDALGGLFDVVSARNRELVELNQSLEVKVVERTQELSRANDDLKSVIAQLEREKEESLRLGRALAAANLQLEAIAATDLLTGLPNRRHAMANIALAWEESRRSGRPLACMLIDADGFKQVNDTWGHEAGDRVLCALSTCLRHAFRNDDLVCRLGGDEFLVLCPNTTLEGAMHIAELARQAVAALTVATGQGQWQGSVSIGVAVRAESMANPEALIKAADDGVYLAKRGGRNCVAAAA
jgi:hemerythrin